MPENIRPATAHLVTAAQGGKSESEVNVGGSRFQGTPVAEAALGFAVHQLYGRQGQVPAQQACTETAGGGRAPGCSPSTALRAGYRDCLGAHEHCQQPTECACVA